MKYKFSDFFSVKDVEAIAISTGFMKRKAKKITPYNFIISFLNLYNTRTFSLRNWACEISNTINDTVSFQAIHKKLTVRHLPFLITIFSKILASNIKSQVSNSDRLMSCFNRVLVEDSTCIKLANSMFNYFSGSSNGISRIAISRIQICLDLKTGIFENCDITTYTRNDGSYSGEVIKRIVKNDLLIRDLGYWKVSVLKDIDNKGAFFLSRFRHNNLLYTANNQRFNLVSYLKNKDKSGLDCIELNLEIGKENNRLKIRLLGKRINPNKYQQRLKNSKISRRYNQKISDASLYLLNWNLIITNVDQELINHNDAFSLYRLRWEIEMFFKNWKSNFKIDALLYSSKGSDPIKPEILMYLSLINMASIYQPNYVYYRNIIINKCQKILSPLKFAEFLKSIFKLERKEHSILNSIINYCCYDVRSDRTNSQKKLLDMGLG